MKKILFLILGLILSICVFSQDTIRTIITKENFVEMTSKIMTKQPTISTATSGLEAYERLLKYYESEKLKVKTQIEIDEIDCKILQLNDKIMLEKNKNIKK